MKKRVFILATIVFLLDQLSKYIVSKYISIGTSIKVIKDFFYIKYINNSGASFGILSNGRWFLITVSVLSIIIIINYIKNTKNKFELTGFGLLLGGIFGNLLDRVVFGEVKDFLDFYIFKYDYPVFNFADICIVIGIIIVLIAMIKGEKDGNSSKRKSRR